MPPGECRPLRPVHVERTSDPAVLRWVCHDAPVRASPPGPRRPDKGSDLAALVGDGTVARLFVRDGDLHAAFTSGTRDPATVRRVHDAVTVALATDAPWLVEPIGDAHAPSIAELQALVDCATGAITELHGGHLEVVERDGGTVTLRAHGACHGCRLSESTVEQYVLPSLRAAGVTATVLVDRPPRASRARRLARPRRRAAG